MLGDDFSLISLHTSAKKLGRMVVTKHAKAARLRMRDWELLLMMQRARLFNLFRSVVFGITHKRFVLKRVVLTGIIINLPTPEASGSLHTPDAMALKSSNVESCDMVGRIGYL